MDFDWDEKKNQTNQQKHHISFEEATEIFQHPIITHADNRRKYGEKRLISIGQLHTIVIVVVVHTKRNNTIRMISARKANRKERRLYYAHIQKTPS